MITTLLLHIISDIVRAWDAAILKHLATDGLTWFCPASQVHSVHDPSHPGRLAQVICNVYGLPGQAHPMGAGR